MAAAIRFAVAALRRWPGPHRQTEVRSTARSALAAAPAVALAALVLAAVAGMVMSRPGTLVAYFADHPPFAVGAVAIAVLAMVLAGTLVRAAREPI